MPPTSPASGEVNNRGLRGLRRNPPKNGMGHVHGDRLADLPLPRRIHDEVIASGRAQPHHILPQTGWVSVWMDGPDDAAGVIELFRLQYDRYVETASQSGV